MTASAGGQWIAGQTDDHSAIEPNESRGVFGLRLMSFAGELLFDHEIFVFRLHDVTVFIWIV